MRHTHYYRQMFGSDEPTKLSFEEADFKRVGLTFMTFGMPMLEALELVDKWNRQHMQYKFWLE